MSKTLTEIASDSKSLVSFVKGTLSAYNKVAKSLHETACASLFHVAQGNDPLPLNQFYNGLRVNDRTALRVWLGTHSTYVDLSDGTVKPWLRYTEKGGFALVKGCESHRKDMFTLGEHVEGKTDLIGLKPFYEKNVKDKDAITLEALIAMLAKAAERVTKQANDEGINLPADVLTLTTSIKNTTTKELEALARVSKEG